MPIGHLWWVKRTGAPKGPYPAALIEKNITLGRIIATDKISPDGKLWQPAGDYPDFEALLQSARADLSGRRAAEESVAGHRASEEAEAEADADAAGDQREARWLAEDAALVARRERSSRVWAGLRPARPGRRSAPLLVVGVLTLGVFALALLQVGSKRPAAQCAAPPGPGVNWEFCPLAGRDFRTSDLQGAVLRNAQLAGADFTGADLRGADLAYADLSAAVLRDARLGGARLTGAVLRGAVLTGSDLRRADLGFADLTGARLTGSLLQDANLDQTILPSGQTCEQAQLQACLRAILGAE